MLISTIFGGSDNPYIYAVPEPGPVPRKIAINYRGTWKPGIRNVTLPTYMRITYAQAFSTRVEVPLIHALHVIVEDV